MDSKGLGCYCFLLAPFRMAVSVRRTFRQNFMDLVGAVIAPLAGRDPRGGGGHTRTMKGWLNAVDFPEIFLLVNSILDPDPRGLALDVLPGFTSS
jgi:hypothetical protein